MRSVEAEQSIIGSLLVDVEGNKAVLDHLDLDHFAENRHRAIFKAIQDVLRANQCVDVVTVGDALEVRSELHTVGGMEYLTHLCEETPSFDYSSVRGYWKILDNHRRRRDMITAAEDILKAVREINDIEELSDLVQQKLNLVSRDVKAETVKQNEALTSMIDRIEHLRSLKEGELVGITTGIDALDELTMGRQAGLHVIAARPAMGKSVAMMQSVEAAAHQGKPCLVISLEMPVDQITTRSVSAAASLNMNKLKDPRSMTDDDNNKFAIGVTKISNLPIEYFTDTSCRIAKLCQVIRAWYRRTENHGGVFIDYLQLMPIGDRQTKNDGFGEITRRLKLLSTELGIQITLLSQLSRGLESRPNKRPINSDLRDSGSIEQDADTITFIYRDEVYNEDTREKGIAELIIGKQRNGPTGTAYAGAEFQYQRFIDIGNYTPPEPELKMGKIYGKGKL